MQFDNVRLNCILNFALVAIESSVSIYVINCMSVNEIMNQISFSNSIRRALTSSKVEKTRAPAA